MKRSFVMFSLVLSILLSSFASAANNEKLPKTITRSTSIIDGMKVEKTLIVLDGNTSREDLIHTCNYLAKENVQLTFEKLSIGKSFIGLIGKQRIRIAQGMIKLSNGSSQKFKAGGAMSFRSLKIQYTSSSLPESSQIEMIEIVD